MGYAAVGYAAEHMYNTVIQSVHEYAVGDGGNVMVTAADVDEVHTVGYNSMVEYGNLRH